MSAHFLQVGPPSSQVTPTMHRPAGGAAHWKRKRHQYDSGTHSGYENQFEQRQKALALLHIQAHEADIVHGVEGKDRAQSLEVDGLGRPGPRSALIQLRSSIIGAGAGWNAEEDSFTLSGGSTNSRKTARSDEREQLWVDRYVDPQSNVFFVIIPNANELLATMD